jgi:phosphate starvation-inducible protein PhoH
VGHVAFSAEDVIRHELVARIVAAYDKHAPQQQSPRRDKKE